MTDNILYPGMGARSPEGRAWWQSETIEEFAKKISEMDRERLEALFLEIKAAVVRVNEHVGDVNRDPERRHAARRALTHMVARKRQLASEISKRQELKVARNSNILSNALVEAEEKAAAGDALGAVKLVIEALKKKR
jgi:hypothetical protein